MTNTMEQLRQADSQHEMLAILQSMVKTDTTAPQSCTLPHGTIHQLPELFQPRGMAPDEKHIQDLVKAIKNNNGPLDPVEVIQVGQETFLIDGHHRMIAYAVAEFPHEIPVRHFKGTVVEAVALSGKANTKAKLNMSQEQRVNYAWMLVRLDGYSAGKPGTLYSKAMISESASVANRTVGSMREVFKKLGDTASDYETWNAARSAASGKEYLEFEDDEAREQWLEAEAQGIADRMQRTFGNKLSRDPEITARALDKYFGRRLPEITHQLCWLLPKTYRDNPDDDLNDIF